jgi:hypothetical protein
VLSRALVVSAVYQHARESFPLVQALSRENVDTHVLVGWRGPSADEYAAQVEDAGATVHRVPADLAYADPWAHEEGKAPRASRRSPARRAASRLLRPVRSAIWFGRAVARFRRARVFGERLVRDLRPSVVIGGAYRSAGTFDQGIARAANAERILYCCVPYSPYLGEAHAVDGRFVQISEGMIPVEPYRADSTAVRRLVAQLFPDWTREQDGLRIFSWHPQTMVAARLAGSLDRRPWLQPSPSYDVVFVESDFSRDLLLRDGFDPSRVVVSGKLLLDEVFARAGDHDHAARLRDALGLADGQPWALFNVEPAYEHGFLDRAAHTSRFERMLDQVRDSGLAPVLSLHPLCAPGDYAYVREKFGVAIPDATIFDLYPYCTVSVSFPCSTNTLAPIFGKPLVVYDDLLGATRAETPGSERFRIPGARYVYDVAELGAAVAEAAAASVPPNATSVPRPAAAVMLDTIRSRV